jgi:hypothetical protein
MFESINERIPRDPSPSPVSLGMVEEADAATTFARLWYILASSVMEAGQELDDDDAAGTGASNPLTAWLS